MPNDIALNGRSDQCEFNFSLPVGSGKSKPADRDEACPVEALLCARHGGLGLQEWLPYILRVPQRDPFWRSPPVCITNHFPAAI
ncbi:MAG: hypothetical protein GVY07_04355 [Bacteroidetes bacterium]|nr:hypothetical protein [Bacteroidota bacterium]